MVVAALVTSTASHVVKNVFALGACLTEGIVQAWRFFTVAAECLNLALLRIIVETKRVTELMLMHSFCWHVYKGVRYNKRF